MSKSVGVIVGRREINLPAYLCDRDADDGVVFMLKAQARALFKKLSGHGVTPEWISKITSDRGEAFYPKP